MIKSFKKRNAAEDIFHGHFVKGIAPDLQKRIHLKLLAIHYAADVMDLRIPSGNRLEALKGDRKGRYSIRVNDQWRVCFIWQGDGADDVELIDYH